MGWQRIGMVAVVAAVVAGCSVDDTGIGKLSGDGGDASGGAGGSGGSGGAGGSGGGGGTGGSAGTGGAPGDGPAPVDTAVDAETPDVPRQPYANGWPCTGPEGCTSGFCVDNVCCESSCGGPCVACARGQTNRSDGECRPIPMGLDPQDDCSDEASACGRTGVCNGNGGCAMGAAGLLCGASTCSGNVVTPPPRCNGAGGCEPQPPQLCGGNYRCADGSVCKGTCAGDGDCVMGSRCDTGTGRCSAPKALGAACNPGDDGRDCASGNCVDGVCCNSECDDDCFACAIAHTGVASGTCAPVAAGKDPRGDCEDDGASSCDEDGTCDGAGECRKYPDGTLCGSTCCGGGGNRICDFACRLGNCDRQTETPRDPCGGGSSCCCSGDGQAACALLCFQTCDDND